MLKQQKRDESKREERQRAAQNILNTPRKAASRQRQTGPLEHGLRSSANMLDLANVPDPATLGDMGAVRTFRDVLAYR